MKIEAQLRDGEVMVTPIAFAEAVIAWWLDPDAMGVRKLFQDRKGLEEVVEYLNTFCRHHPIRDYEPVMSADKL